MSKHKDRVFLITCSSASLIDGVLLSNASSVYSVIEKESLDWSDDEYIIPSKFSNFQKAKNLSFILNKSKLTRRLVKVNTLASSINKIHSSYRKIRISINDMIS